MNKPLSAPARRGLPQRMIEDMNVRGFSAKTQHDYLRIVSRFAAFLGRTPDSATAEDVRRFQIEQREAGMPAPAMNRTAMSRACGSSSQPRSIDQTCRASCSAFAIRASFRRC